MQNNSLIAQFNRIYNDYCSIYRNIAKHFGLSETVFWILYTLIDENKPITQSYLCGIIYLPKQTINSALKKMETDGLITLKPAEDNRSKKILLTDVGKQLAEKTVEHLRNTENRALERFSYEEQHIFIDLFGKYNQNLKEELGKLKNGH